MVTYDHSKCLSWDTLYNDMSYVLMWSLMRSERSKGHQFFTLPKIWSTDINGLTKARNGATLPLLHLNMLDRYPAMILTHPCSSILDNEHPIGNEKRPMLKNG